ncbi:hypothetical protein ABGB12_01030 [Actinocorallia sp. B10E7]|uniref:hypothetical protein n=1 Tax=Actinocorallia sp. B10E7 TaxID=3153558 RepID=UPI00325E3C9C
MDALLEATCSTTVRRRHHHRFRRTGSGPDRRCSRACSDGQDRGLWNILEQKFYDAGVSPAEIEAGARRLLVKARGRLDLVAGFGDHTMRPPRQ